MAGGALVVVVVARGMELTADERAELRALVNSAEVPATVATRARIVLWRSERRPKKQVAELAGVTRPTVDLWLSRYASDGIAGLLDRPRGAGREQVPASIRARILAVARTSNALVIRGRLERAEGVTNLIADRLDTITAPVTPASRDFR